MNYPLVLFLLVRYYFASKQPIAIALQHTALPIFYAFCRAILCSQHNFVLAEAVQKIHVIRLLRLHNLYQYNCIDID